MGIRKFVCRQARWAMDMASGMMPAAFAGGMSGKGMPVVGSALPVDVCEDLDGVFVVADLPGVERENLAVRLLSPTELGISGMRCSETAETAGGGQFMRRERTCGRVERVVVLPGDAAAAGATASLENGVLTVRLRKAERGERIPIE
jgi:HSP20 family protein